MRVRDGHSRQKRHMSKGIGARNATMCMKKPKQFRGCHSIKYVAGSSRQVLRERFEHLSMILEAFGIPLKGFKLRNNMVRVEFRSIAVAVEEENRIDREKIYRRRQVRKLSLIQVKEKGDDPSSAAIVRIERRGRSEEYSEGEIGRTL